MKELPFVMGVLGDFSGQPEKPLAAMKDQASLSKSIPTTSTSVLKGMAPSLSYSVDNKLSSDPNAGQVKVDLREIIQSIPIEEDRFGFEPEITVKIAKRRLRIYEVGITYWGRTYEEGKKIGWKDGVRAL